MVNGRFRLLLLAGLSAIAAPAAAQDKPLGNSLADETCVARERNDIATSAGLPRDLRLVCDGKESGTLAYSRLGALPVGEARKAALVAAFEASRAGILARDRLDCRAPQWVGPEGSLMALPCRARSGGWPALVLASEANGALAVAEGPASLFPTMAAALGKPVAGSRSELVAQLQKVWGEPVVLASAADIDRLKSLLRDARVANGASKYGAAETLFRQALELHTRLFSENDTTAAEILMDLALNVSNQGRSDEAAALFRRAEPIMQRSARLADRARLATYLGYEAANRADYANALAQARTAATLWQQVADGQGSGADAVNAGPARGRTAARGEVAMALNLQALMALRQDDPTSAYAAASEALLIINSTKGLPAWWRADVLSTLGQVSAAQGRISAAETYFKNALELRQRISGEGLATLRIRTQLGRAYQGEGMNTSAIVAYRDAFRIARTLPKEAVPFTAEDLVPFGAAIVDYAATLNDEKARQGLYGEAFDAFQMVRAPLVDRTVEASAARLSASNPEIAKLMQDIGDASRAADFARVKLAHEQSLADGERSAEVEDKLRADIKANDDRAAATRRSLFERFPDYATLAKGRALQLDDLRSRLADGEGLVSFIVGRQRSFVQLVSRDGVYIGAVPESATELGDSVTALRRSLEIQGGSINEFDLSRSHALYRDLFGSIEPQLAGLTRLTVVPGGPLASLPFALLVTSAPKNSRYENADWLMRKVAVAHTPSLLSFYTLRTARPAAKPDRPLLAFGDPALAPVSRLAQTTGFARLAGSCRQDGPMPAELLKGLVSLPDTATELRTVARALNAAPDELFLGGNASEANLRGRDLARYRVLYLATHGLLPGELKCQAEPGLVLTPPTAAQSRADDGLLEASEVAGLKLNADLVVLSACNTAAAGRMGGESLSGLSEAFFHAGARNMLVSHWQVPSAATSSLMSSLFTELGAASAATPADALRDAQMKMAADPRTAHPFFWAAFVVMGDGGMPATTARLAANTRAAQ